jgi:hypothetical protein
MRRVTSPPYRSTESELAEPLVSARGGPARVATASRSEKQEQMQGE